MGHLVVVEMWCLLYSIRKNYFFFSLKKKHISIFYFIFYLFSFYYCNISWIWVWISMEFWNGKFMGILIFALKIISRVAPTWLIDEFCLLFPMGSTLARMCQQTWTKWPWPLIPQWQIWRMNWPSLSWRAWSMLVSTPTARQGCVVSFVTLILHLLKRCSLCLVANLKILLFFF